MEEEEIIYEKNGKRFSHSQFVEKFGDKAEQAIQKFGYTPVKQNVETKPAGMYEKNGKRFSYDQFVEKYGEKADKAIEKFGYKAVETEDEVGNLPLINPEPVKKKDVTSTATPTVLESNGTKEKDNTSLATEEDLSFWQNLKNNVSNIGSRFGALDDQLNIVSADIYEKVLGKEGAQKFYDFANPESLDESRSKAFKAMKEMEAEMKNTNGIVESIENRDPIALAGGVVTAMSNLVTSLPMAIPYLGVAYAGAQFGGQSFYDYNSTKAEKLGISVDELYKTEQNDFAVPAGAAVLGASLEKFGLLGIKNMINAKVANEGWKNAALIFTETQKEGITELLQFGTESFNKSMAEGNSVLDASEDAAKKMFSKEGLENYLMGVVAAGTTGGMAHTAKVIKDKADRDIIAVNQKNIEALMKDLDNQLIDDDVKAKLKATADQLQDQNKQIIQNAVQKIDEQDDKDFVLLHNIDTEQNKIAREAKKILQDEALSEESAQILYEQKMAEWDALEVQKEQIINPKQTTQEDATATNENEETKVTTEQQNDETKPADQEQEVATGKLEEVDGDEYASIDDEQGFNAFDETEIGADLYEDTGSTEINPIQSEEDLIQNGDSANESNEVELAAANEVANPIANPVANEVANEVANPTANVEQTTEQTPEQVVEQTPEQTPKQTDKKPATQAVPKPYVSKNKRYRMERNEKGQVVLFNRKGKKPAKVSNTLQQRYRAEYIKNADFNSGQRAITSTEQGKQIYDYAAYIADNSENAAEIAEALQSTELGSIEKDFKDEAIAAVIKGGNVSKESLIEMIGNGIEGITKAYFNTKKGLSLDKLALKAFDVYKSMDEDGYNANDEQISPQEIADFIVANPNGLADFYNRANPTKVALLGKFEQLTGLPATPKIINEVAKQNVIEGEVDETHDQTNEQDDEGLGIESDYDFDEVPFDKGGEGWIRETVTVKKAEKMLAKLSKRYGIEAALVDMGLFGAYGRFDRRSLRISINSSTTLDKDSNLTAATEATGYVPKTTMVHEFMHPFVEILAHHNPELYNRILEEAKSVNETEQFANIDHYSEVNRDEELVVRYMERLAANEKNPTLLQQFFTWLSELFYSKKKNNAATLQQLNSDTSIEELYQIFKDYGNLATDVVPLINKENIVDEIKWSEAILESELQAENPRTVVIENFKKEIERLKESLVHFDKAAPAQTSLADSSLDFKLLNQSKEDAIALKKLNKALEDLKVKADKDLANQKDKSVNRETSAQAIKKELVEELSSYLAEKTVLENIRFADIKAIASSIASADTIAGFRNASETFHAIKISAHLRELKAGWKEVKQNMAKADKQAAEKAVLDKITSDLNAFIETEIKDQGVLKFLTDSEKLSVYKIFAKVNTEEKYNKAVARFTDMIASARARELDAQAKTASQAFKKQILADRKQALADEIKDFEKAFFALLDNKSVRVMYRNEVKRIKDRLAAAKTPNTVQKAIKDLTDLFYTLESRKVMNDINKLLNRKLTKLESGRRKLAGIAEREAKVLLGVKNLMKQMAANRDKSTPSIVSDTEFLERIQDEYDSLLKEPRLLTDVEIIQLQSLHLAIGIAKAKTTTNKADQYELLAASLEDLQATWTDGKTKFLEWLTAKQNYKRSKVNPMIEATNAKDGITPMSLQERENLEKSWISKLATTAYNILLGKGGGDMITAFRIVDVSGSAEMNDSVWTDFHEEATGASTVKTANLRKNAEIIKEAQARIFGVDKTQTKVNGRKHFSEMKMHKILGKKHSLLVENKAVKDMDGNFEVDEDGNTITESYHAPFSESQLLNLWMHYQNPELKPKFDAAGYSEKFMDKVDQILDSRTKEYGEFLFDFYDGFYEGVNEVYKDMYGHSLGRPAKYAGKLMHEGFSQEEQNLMDFNKVARTAAAKSTKERTTNALPIVAQDVNNSLARYLYEMEHFKAYAKVYDVYNSVLENQAFKRSVMDNHPKIGKALMNNLAYYRDSEMARGGVKGDKLQMMDFVMSNYVKATLALKPKIALTQTLSWTNAVSFLPTGKYAYMGYQPATYLRDLKHVMKNSQYISNRWDAKNLNQAMTGLNTVTAEQAFNDSGTAGSGAKQMARLYDAVQNALMYNVKLGDMVGVSGSIPVYTGWKQKYIDQGYTEANAEIKAMRKFEAAVDRAQQSQTGFGKSELQSHPFVKYFAMFATSVLQNYRNAMLSYMELYRHTPLSNSNAKGTITRHVFAIANYSFMQPMLYAYVSNRLLGLDFLFDDEDDERELIDAEKSMISAFMLGNMTAMPFIGSILTLLMDKTVLGKEHSFGGVLSNPLSDEGNKLEQNIERLVKAKTPKAKEDAMKACRNSVMKLASGMPIQTVEKYIELIKDADKIRDTYDLQERFFMMLGNDKKAIEFDRKDKMKIGKMGTEMHSTLKKANIPIAKIPAKKE